MRTPLRQTAGVVAAAVLALASGLWHPASAAAGRAAPDAAAALDRVQVDRADLTPPPAPVVGGVQLRGTWLGPYTYRNARAGKCLDIEGASTASLAPAVQYNCVAGGVSQMWWEWKTEGDGFIYFRLLGNAHSRLCLHADGRNIPIKQVGCATLPNQVFYTRSENLHQIISDLNYECMEIQGGSPDNFARIVLWPCHGQSHQVWYKYAV
jgi:hypothetical protein